MTQYRRATFHAAFHAATLLVSLTASNLLYAETITFQALGDFPTIDAGEVPYYTEGARGTLAINAAIEQYRDKFARATATYAGSGGSYDLTLNTLGELDGDCEYRVLVNGTVVGTVVNDPVTADYTEQFHTFNDITVPAGATLSVESNALSNGLIPEGDAFAFARGRWRSLTLQNDAPATTNPVDMQISASAVDGTLQVGSNFTVNIEVTNASDSVTATQPIVTVGFPAALNLTVPAQCAMENNESLACALPELSPQQSQSLSLSGTANAAGDWLLATSISADQTDNNNSNNSSDVTLAVATASPAGPVDLQLSLTASNGQEAIVIGDVITYTLNVANAHSTNVATAPTAGVVLPANLQFQSSGDCSQDGSNVLCSLSELAPGETSTAAFTVSAVSAGDATLIASVSATEPEDIVNDNEIVLPLTVITTSPASAPTDKVEGGNSGGGSLSLMLLLGLLCRGRRAA